MAPAGCRDYVAGAARNAARRYHRTAARRREVFESDDASIFDHLARSAEDLEELPTSEDLLVAAAESAECTKEVDLAVLRTSTRPRFWRAFHAHVVLDLPVRFIAAMERVPLATIYTRIRWARLDLRAAVLRRRVAVRHR